MDDGLSRHKRPYIRVERPELSLDGQKRLGVGDRCIDLEPVPDNGRILQQLGLRLGGEPRYFLWIEAGKSLSIALALPQDCVPRQPGMRAFQSRTLEMLPITMHRLAPIPIVIADHVRLVFGPRTADRNGCCCFRCARHSSSFLSIGLEL